MFQTLVSYVISFGQIPTKMYRVGEKMIEESVSHSVEK